MAEALVRALDGAVLTLRPEAMPLYHAAAALASNYVVALVDGAVALMDRAGIPREQALHALSPLVEATAANLRELALPQALTGPVRRGDVDTIRRHRAAVARESPEIALVYDLLGARLLSMAQELGEADDGDLRAIGRLFSAGGPPRGSSRGADLPPDPMEPGLA